MRAGFGPGVEVEKSLELPLDAGDVLVELLAREQLALLRLAAGIANHAGAAADDGDRMVPESLQARQPHHRQQRADMEARRRRIEADVGRDRLPFQQVGQSLRGLGHHAAPDEFVVKVGHVEAERYYISRWQ